MSLGISTVRTTAVSLLTTILGAGWNELPFQVDIDLNNTRSLDKGFSVQWGEGSQVYLIDQCVNLEQDLEVELSRRIFIRNDDAKATVIIDSMYDSVADIAKQFCFGKLGIPATVQQVEMTRLEKPKRAGEGRDIAVIKMIFRVRYLVT
jgi:hypothetical protein